MKSLLDELTKKNTCDYDLTPIKEDSQDVRTSLEANA